MRGIGFGLYTARDDILSYFGLTADLPLASHDRDEFLRYCACVLVAIQRSWVCFEQSELKSEDVVVFASAPPATVLWTISDYKPTIHWYQTTETDVTRYCACVLVAIRRSWTCFEA